MYSGKVPPTFMETLRESTWQTNRCENEVFTLLLLSANVN